MRVYIDRKANHISLNYGGIIKVSDLKYGDEIVIDIENAKALGKVVNSVETLKFADSLYQTGSTMTVSNVIDYKLDEIDTKNSLCWTLIDIKEIYGLNCLVLKISQELLEHIEKLGYEYISFDAVLRIIYRYESRTSITDNIELEVVKIEQVLVRDRTNDEMLTNFDTYLVREEFLVNIIEKVYENIDKVSDLLFDYKEYEEDSEEVLNIIVEMHSVLKNNSTKNGTIMLRRYLNKFDSIPIDFLQVLNLTNNMVGNPNVLYMLANLFSYSQDNTLKG